MDFLQRMRECQARADNALDRWLPADAQAPARLHAAMRYAVLGNGKRVRPLLVYLAGEAVAALPSGLDAPAVAVELIHAYSLVHDDMPAMDNDDLRRGRPTCHRAFDEATAMLTGDALQALAFDVLASDIGISVSDRQRVDMIRTLARAGGSSGMAGGQAIDLAAVGQQLTLSELETMHRHKTGALIRASVRLGGLSAEGVSEDVLAALDHYADAIGLAFQVQDDILDVEGVTATIGKPQGSDAARNKPTYPNLLGLEGARRVAEELRQRALASLQSLGPSADALRHLADYIVRRER